jgi:hypothetical protein
MSMDPEKAKLDLLRTLVEQTFGEIKAQMKRLRLDRGKATYDRPLDLLEAAYLAIRYPSSAQGGAASALLALRGCIECSIDELVRRRPAQEEAASRRQDRILSIGRHCGRRGLALAHFDSLAAEDESVNQALAGKGSQATLEPPEVVKHFLRGAQFLRALLASVDEALLRA